MMMWHDGSQSQLGHVLFESCVVADFQGLSMGPPAKSFAIPQDEVGAKERQDQESRSHLSHLTAI
jgi:hypothetical protein